MPSRSIPFEAAARRHFEARISHTAGLIQAVGVLVKAGSLRVQQQTFVKNAVWDPAARRGSNGYQAAHVVAGGLYVVQRAGDPRFGMLRRCGYREDEHGCLVTPLYESAMSAQGRYLISAQLTATTVLPLEVNRVELAAEGTRGNQLPVSAGEKTALEHAVSLAKTGAPGWTLDRISHCAVEQTRRVCQAVAAKLAGRDEALRAKEGRADRGERESIKLQRELIELKLEVVSRPDRALDLGALSREASLLHEYEMNAHEEVRRAIERTAASYRAEEAAARR